jgi:hypothetical protein
MWDPWCLTTLCASTACYMDNLTFLLRNCGSYSQTTPTAALNEKRFKPGQIIYGTHIFIYGICDHMPITVATRSKTRTVFARSNTGVVCSNPTRGMDVCVRLFPVYVVLCIGRGLATCWSPVEAVLPTVYKMKKLKRGQGPTIDRQICDRIIGCWDYVVSNDMLTSE